MPHGRQFVWRVVLFLGQSACFCARRWFLAGREAFADFLCARRFLAGRAEFPDFLAATRRALRPALNVVRSPSVAVFAVMSAPCFMPRLDARRGPI